MVKQNYINHICFVLDASYSMSGLENEVVKVADNQIRYLAQRSQELDQETRITVYTFSSRDTVKCLIYDKDVLRMPSIASLYVTSGMTALIDATFLAIEDLELTPEKYGEHAFLLYVLTDGMENNSKMKSTDLSRRISRLPDHWTLAAFVPNQLGVFETKKFGFPVDNIAIWDASSAKGIAEAGETIRRTSEQFMQNRTQGIRGTKSLFRLKEVSVGDIRESLHSLPVSDYSLLYVAIDERVDSFVERNYGRYSTGMAFYQLTKSETIQPQKRIAIMVDNKVYTGKEARSLLGLPDYSVRVQPSAHPGYRIFVQSTSVNRKLIGGTSVLIFDRDRQY